MNKKRGWTKDFFTKRFTFKIRFSWTRKEGEQKISLQKDLHLRLGSLEQEEGELKISLQKDLHLRLGSLEQEEGELKISLQKDLHLRLGSLEQEKRVNWRFLYKKIYI